MISDHFTGEEIANTEHTQAPLLLMKGIDALDEEIRLAIEESDGGRIMFGGKHGGNVVLISCIDGQYAFQRLTEMSYLRCLQLPVLSF